MVEKNTGTSYRLLLALAEPVHLEAWADLAVRLVGDGGEVLLRGLVTVPVDKSLSEGTTAAQNLRNALDGIAREHVIVYDETEVRVDYRPLLRVLTEARELDVDLLLIQWAGPFTLTGGMSTDDILGGAPCDVVLLSGDDWRADGPVLLSLRGGPNLTLGVRMARALAQEETITLFHAADSTREGDDLNALIDEQNVRVRRTVAAVGTTGETLLSEAVGHKAIILGASFNNPGRVGKTAAAGSLVRRVAEAGSTPICLVRTYNPEDLRFHAPRRSTERISTRVDRWFAENSFHSSEYADLRALVALKERQGVTISIGLPALNEEETVGHVIRTLKTTLMEQVPLVDEIVLIDSNSTDNTVAIAQDCGIPTYRHPDILPEMGSYVGKGEALWKSLHVLKGDIVAWVDTDITNIHPRFIYGLLGPLLKRPHVQYVKGFYNRPIRVGDVLHAYGGGRVTELVVRPLFNLYFPELSGLVQPLSGEYAGRREALEQVPFFTGYGVETGLCIDMLERYGLEGIAQCDLEERVHHNQPLVGLSKMSFAILQVLIGRIDQRFGFDLLDKANRSMKLIARDADRFALDIESIADTERPPMIMVPAYQQRRALVGSGG